MKSRKSSIEEHKLQIRRPSRTLRGASFTSEGEVKPNKKADREFLSLLSKSDHVERAVAFMGVASVETRIYLNTVMKKASPDLQARILDFLDKIDVPTCELLLKTMNPLSSDLMAKLFDLQFVIDWDRFLKTLKLSQETTSKFLEIIYDMSPEDRYVIARKQLRRDYGASAIAPIFLFV